MATETHDRKVILWWGRFDSDYSRNRILRQLMQELGYQLVDFHPHVSRLAHIEAFLRGIKKPACVWVPCFRQRDILAAAVWARRNNVPLIFDPLISAWDKQVFERQKFDENSVEAKKLLARETSEMQSATAVIADTFEHAQFFQQTFKLHNRNVYVLPVCADENLFKPAARKAKDYIEVLFYGSFIHLQGPQIIVEAARHCADKTIRWTLLGKGPLLDNCRQAAKGLNNIYFEGWVQFENLPARIHLADILLGVFGNSAKAGRVIPNKVYQALACGRPVITRTSTAYPLELENSQQSGLFQVPAADSMALADQVMTLAQIPEKLEQLGQNARVSYERYFSNAKLKTLLEGILDRVLN